MSDFTQASFELTTTEGLWKISASANKLFDACTVRDMHVKGRHCYMLTIAELALKEALPILDGLKKQFNITFVVEYGVY